MSHRPSDEGGCYAASWDSPFFDCYPGPVEVVTAHGRLVAVSFCERCGQLSAVEVTPESVRPWTHA